MSTGDFDGTPLVAGSVTATRVFSVDSLGRLRSPSMDRSEKTTIITPGVNEAQCIQPGTSHAAPVADCRCGFWAYSDEHRRTTYESTTSPNVHGVIEASGRVVHGTKGVRAEKMRVVAMVDPTAKEEEKPLTKRQRFACWVFTHNAARGLFMWAMLVAFSGAFSAGSVYGLGEGDPRAWWCLPAMVMSVVAACVVWVHEAEGEEILDPGQPFAEDLFARVVRNYPDVRVYATWEAMLDAHPVTPPPAPPAPREPSPDDEDFWTRAAA